MSRLQVRPLLAVAALAAISGCAAETGYQLPDLPQSGGGGVYAPYSVYRPGYYFGYPGYDPRHYGYGAYNPYAYQGGPYPYGYGYGYYPYPGYVVVPCVDSNRDGRCDRHPGRHDDDPHQGGNGQGGHSPGDHHDGGKNRSGGKDDRPRDGAGGTTAPVRPSVPDWKQPRAVDPGSLEPRPRQSQRAQGESTQQQ